MVEVGFGFVFLHPGLSPEFARKHVKGTHGKDGREKKTGFNVKFLTNSADVKDFNLIGG